MQRKTNTILAGIGLVVACILVSGFVGTKSASAYTASITTNNSISFDISPSGDGTSIHSESINVQSDCRAGYNLTIATPQGSNLYKNGSTGNGTSFTSVDGTSALNSSNNTNKWGYTLTANPTSSTVFLPLSSTQAVLKTPSQTASPSADVNDTFDINYGAQVSNSVDAGNYQMANNGTIVYYLTMDTTCTQYTVAFNTNGGTGTMDSQGIEPGESAKLTSADSLTAPQGASYTDAGNNTITGTADKLWTFWGWNTQIDGSGDWYKDKEEVEDLASVGSTITLYAQWKQATLADMVMGAQVDTEKVIDHNLMQDMRPEVCYNSDITTAANAPAATLLDYRGKVTTGESPESPEQYTVSKLADGNCWMTTNLNLGRNDNLGPNNNGTITLTSEDTDLANNTTFTLPKSTTTSSNTSTAATIRTTNTSGNNNNGTYYSWAAAVANTTSMTTNPVTSVCPKNWDLPTNTQYTNLKDKSSYSSSNRPTAAPSTFLATGGFTNGATFYGATSYGHYWTSASTSSSVAYYARLTTSDIIVGSSTGTSTTAGGNKYFRKNIRCVSSNGKATINYDGNGTNEYPVTGTTASQENVELNTNPTTRSNGFTRTDWTFSSWNTAVDGSGTSIAAGASISALNLKPGETITLYAQWLPKYTITYVNNCMSWTSSDVNCTVSASATTSEQKINLTSDPSTGTEAGTLAAYNKYTLTGWKIYGWTTNADGTGTEYRANSTYTVPAGSSVGDGITLYAHWVPIYAVQYDGNGSDNDATGMGSTDATTGIKTVNHTNVAEGDTFDLFASNFKKAGYGFVGWSTDQNAWAKLTDNDSTNDARIWGPNEVFTAPASNGTLITTLYAVWAPAETSGGNPVYLQGWTGCSAMTATAYNSSTSTLTVTKDSITALTDERDGEVYAIARLADGNCWMIENLRLADTHEESGTTVATILTTSNTNIDTNNNTLPIINIYNADSSLATKSNSLSPSSSVAYNASSAPYGWCNANSAACDDQSRLNTTNTVTNATPSKTQSITSANAHSDFSTTVYAYGNYYNWYSATAGYGTYSGSTTEPTAGDLCPAGWKLPYGSTSTGTGGGNTKGGFYYLANRMSATGINQVSSNKFRMFPNNFIYSGYWNGGSAGSRGNYGYYWSASAFDNNSAFHLRLRSVEFYPGNGGDVKYYGYSVRCISDTPHTVTINLGSHVQSVTITGHGLSQTFNTSGGTITLAEGKRYAISATYDYGYGVNTWSTTTGGTIGSTTTDLTTYSVTADTTLFISAKGLSYTVQYDGNGSDNDSTGMGSTDASTGLKAVRHTNVDEGDTFDLFASNFKKSGYGFVGWSTDQNAWTKLTDDDTANDAKIWGPNEVFTAPAYSGEITTLYAVWAPAETSGGNPVYLQNWTGCSAMTATTYDNTTGTLTVAKNSITALTDERDGNVYAIAKLADESCWMIENLRLADTHDESGSTVATTLTTSNTNIDTNNNTLPITNIYSSSTTSNSLSPSSSQNSTNDASYGWCQTNSAACDDQSRLNTTNTVANITPSQTQNITSANAHASFNNTIYSYGNYYNWYSATAGYGTYSRSTSTPTDGDLCPAGWRLPYGSSGTSTGGGNTKGGFYYLANQMSATASNRVNSNKFRMFPNNFIYSGQWDGGSAYNRGIGGTYWPASANGSDSAYNLYLYITGISPGNSVSSKYSGYSVRCVSAQ